MSKEIISQRMRISCGGCGLTKEYELVTPTETELTDMQTWFAIERKVIVGGQLVQLVEHAHALECVPSAAARLLAPNPDDAPDNIDLKSLRSQQN